MSIGTTMKFTDAQKFEQEIKRLKDKSSKLERFADDMIEISSAGLDCDGDDIEGIAVSCGIIELNETEYRKTYK